MKRISLLVSLFLIVSVVYARPPLYFAYYGDVLMMNADFTGLNHASSEDRMADAGVVNLGQKGRTKTSFAGPVIDQNTGDVYFSDNNNLGYGLSGAILQRRDSVTGVLEDLIQDNAMFTPSPESSPDVAFGYDSVHERLIWTFGSAGTVDIRAFYRGNATWDVLYEDVVLGERPDSTFVTSDGINYFLTTYSQVIKLEFAGGAPIITKLIETGTYTNIQSVYVRSDGSELYFTITQGADRGIYRIDDPITAGINAPVVPVETWRECEKYFGIAVHESTNHYYTYCKQNYGTGSGSTNLPAVIMRGSTNTDNPMGLNRAVHSLVIVTASGGNTLDHAKYMAVYQDDWEIEPTFSTRGPDIRDTQNELTGIVLLGSPDDGSWDYIYVDHVKQIEMIMFVCPKDTLYGRYHSPPYVDSQTGWMYYICRNTLYRADITSIIFHNMSINDPGIEEQIVAVGGSYEIGGEVGWRAFTNTHTFGPSMGMDDTDGTLYFATRLYTSLSPILYHTVWYRWTHGETYIPSFAFEIEAIDDHQGGPLLIRGDNAYVSELLTGIWRISDFRTLPKAEMVMNITTRPGLVSQSDYMRVYDISQDEQTIYYFAYPQLEHPPMNGVDDERWNAAQASNTHVYSRTYDSDSDSYPLSTEQYLFDTIHRGGCSSDCWGWEGQYLALDYESNLIFVVYENVESQSFSGYYEMEKGIFSEDCYYLFYNGGNPLFKNGQMVNPGSAILANECVFPTAPYSVSKKGCNYAQWFDPVFPSEWACRLCTKPATPPASGVFPRCRLSCLDLGAECGTCYENTTTCPIPSTDETSDEAISEDDMDTFSDTSDDENTASDDTNDDNSSDTSDTENTASTSISSNEDTNDDTSSGDTMTTNEGETTGDDDVNLSTFLPILSTLLITNLL